MFILLWVSIRVWFGQYLYYLRIFLIYNKNFLIFFYVNLLKIDKYKHFDSNFTYITNY